MRIGFPGHLANLKSSRLHPIAGTLIFVVAMLPGLAQSAMPAPVLAISLGLGAILVAASVIDWQSFILPDRLTLPLIAAGVAVTWWLGNAPIWWSMVSAALGYGLLWVVDRGYRALRGRSGIGMGDAKLLAAAGAWLGAEALPTVLLWATALALLGAIVLSLRGQTLVAGTRLPFGPALALGLWLTWWYGAIG